MHKTKILKQFKINCEFWSPLNIYPANILVSPFDEAINNITKHLKKLLILHLGLICQFSYTNDSHSFFYSFLWYLDPIFSMFCIVASFTSLSSLSQWIRSWFLFFHSSLLSHGHYFNFFFPAFLCWCFF